MVAAAPLLAAVLRAPAGALRAETEADGRAVPLPVAIRAVVARPPAAGAGANPAVVAAAAVREGVGLVVPVLEEVVVAPRVGQAPAGACKIGALPLPAAT